MKDKKENFYPPLFGVLPYNIMADKTLSSVEKITFSIVLALSRSNGKCFAGNKDIADVLQLSPNRIGVILGNLEQKGFLIRALTKNRGGTSRTIKPIIDGRLWGIVRDDDVISPDNPASHPLKIEKIEIDGKIKDTEVYNIYDFRELKAYFIIRYKEKKLVDYAFAGGKDGNAIKRFLAMQDRPDWKKLVDFFFNHKKSEEYPTISACLSTDTINQFRLHHRPSLKEQFDQLK